MSTTIGGFKVVRKISQGSQSVTYLATPPPELQKKLPAQVALKRIASNVLRPSDISVFLKLHHPSIVPCYAALQHEDQVVLVTPFYEGGDLEHLIQSLAKKQQRLDFDTVISWMVQLIRALQFCHAEHKIIHRDLRLSNIFVSPDSKSVFLGGFGLARALDRGNTTGAMTVSTTAGSTLVGSPVSLSPEVISGHPYSYASDVWSLGCLVFELLTFEKPFHSPSFAQVVLKVCNGQYDALPASVPRALREAVSGMLQVDPKQRWLLTEIVDSDNSFSAAYSAQEDQQRHQQQQQKLSAANSARAADVVVAVTKETPPQPPTVSFPQQPQQQASDNKQQRRSNSRSVSPAAAPAQPQSSSSSNNNNRCNSNSSNQKPIASGGSNSSGSDGSLSTQQEDLDQWVQWKYREFAQIEAVLKKVGGTASSSVADIIYQGRGSAGSSSGIPLAPPAGSKASSSAKAAAAAAGAGRKYTIPGPSDPFHDAETPPPPPAVSGVPPSMSAAALGGGRQLDSKRGAQRMLPSPRAGKLSGAADNAPMSLPPPPPPHGRRAGGGAAAAAAVAAASAGGGAAGGALAVAANKQTDAVTAAAAAAADAKRAAAVAASAEKRNAQRAELLKKIAEGRAKAGGGNAGDVVIATPSRLLNMNPGGGDGSNIGEQQPASSAAAAQQQEKKTPQRSSGLKEEIARRRAEVKASPAGRDGPDIEIIMPANMMKFL